MCAVVVWRGGVAAKFCVNVVVCVSIVYSHSVVCLVSVGSGARFVGVLECMGSGCGQSEVNCMVWGRCGEVLWVVQRLGGRGPKVVVGILGVFHLCVIGIVYGRMGCCCGVAIAVTSRSAGGSWR